MTYKIKFIVRDKANEGTASLQNKQKNQKNYIRTLDLEIP